MDCERPYGSHSVQLLTRAETYTAATGNKSPGSCRDEKLSC